MQKYVRLQVEQRPFKVVQPVISSFDSILARNVEYYNFGRDNVHTKVTELESDYEGNHIKSGNASGNLNAWYLHLAEGIDESSRQEFDVLVQNDLLVGELVVIHGTGLTETEFNALGAVGADLVWSPISNLLLYGQTTDVAAAKQAGMNITLAPDWSPSGAKNPLHELKVADWWNKNELNTLFSNYELVEMVTTNPQLPQIGLWRRVLCKSDWLQIFLYWKRLIKTPIEI